MVKDAEVNAVVGIDYLLTALGGAEDHAMALRVLGAAVELNLAHIEDEEERDAWGRWFLEALTSHLFPDEPEDMAA